MEHLENPRKEYDLSGMDKPALVALASALLKRNAAHNLEMRKLKLEQAGS